jgi:hypothetical protein
MTEHSDSYVIRVESFGDGRIRLDLRVDVGDEPWSSSEEYGTPANLRRVLREAFVTIAMAQAGLLTDDYSVQDG